MAEQDNTTEKKGISKGTSKSEKAEKKPSIFAVLWMPSLIRESIVDHPIRTTITRNLSTIANDSFNVEISLQENHDIVISIIDGEEKRVFLKLTYVQDSNNGLVEYTYTETRYNDCTDGFRFTSDCFPAAVYHMIKELYHEHEFHDPEANAAITPFISESYIDLRENYNQALLHYLKEFEKTLTSLVCISRQTLCIIRDRNEVYRDYNSMRRLRIAAHGRMTYYYNLIDTVCLNHYREIPTRIQREIQNSIFNIENSMRYFNMCDFELEQRDMRSQIIIAKNQSKFALISVLITIILSLLGIFFSYRISGLSSKELDNMKYELIENMNTLEKRLDSFEKESNSTGIEVLEKQGATKEKQQK